MSLPTRRHRVVLGTLFTVEKDKNVKVARKMAIEQNAGYIVCTNTFVSREKSSVVTYRPT